MKSLAGRFIDMALPTVQRRIPHAFMPPWEKLLLGHGSLPVVNIKDEADPQAVAHAGLRAYCPSPATKWVFP
jgi:hypothetical protein